MPGMRVPVRPQMRWQHFVAAEVTRLKSIWKMLETPHVVSYKQVGRGAAQHRRCGIFAANQSQIIFSPSGATYSNCRWKKRWRATALQNAGAFYDAPQTARSVLVCAGRAVAATALSRDTDGFIFPVLPSKAGSRCACPLQPKTCWRILRRQPNGTKRPGVRQSSGALVGA
jgi:hypothetical protein